jgi:hypothetical protein
MKYKLCHLIAIFFLYSFTVIAQYNQPEHRLPHDGEIAVDKPGYYGISGASYILMNNIRSDMSAIFLGKDITFDLNGYTITYADGNYEHIPNSSFEEGLKDWDLSKAPSARIKDTKVHVFIGDKILRLAAGEEIVSQYIHLPVANRSYFAMCGVTKMEMEISIFVEDINGTLIRCITKYSDTTLVSCPVESRSPRMGGGFVYAHLCDLPSDKYRIRVKAVTDCLIDYIDLRPAMDVGIGIVEKTHPTGHYDHLYNRTHSAFYDYTADVKRKMPIGEIPVVTGTGTVVIRNGIIRNATPGVLSWGIQSTAEDASIVLDNLRIEASGINSTAVDVPQATITRCTFDVNNPFIINRHGAEFYAVDLRGEKPSEVSFSEFYGGQGCLVFKGNFSRIHHNHFVNRQTVTNHYSVMAMGDSSVIFENLFEPEVGSGIEIYVHRGMQIFNNRIRIMAAPPTCEYGHEDYSTTAIRIADYGAKQGSSEGCFGNKIFNNKFYITGRDYPDYPDYIPMAWAVFYSASAGDNYIFGNEIEVNDLNPGAKNETSAFYIGGSAVGGQFYQNCIKTNVPAAWVASRYGGAKDTKIFNNVIIKSPAAESDFKPFRMGWMGWKGCVAENVVFESNDIEGASFEVDATEQPHSYSVYWTLTVRVTDKAGKPADGAVVKILNKEGIEVFNLKTSSDGITKVPLLEYSYNNAEIKHSSPYTLIVGKSKKMVNLDKNTEVTLITK